MQDKFWTPELWCEFINQGPLIGALEAEMEQFKSSKSPKKEWEVVAFRERCGIGIYKLREDGRYRNDDFLYVQGLSLKEMLEDGDIIISVRRLSDGEIFSVGDRIKPNENCSPVVITQFTTTDTVLRVHNKDGYFPSGDQFWRCMFKLPQPILTTVDGVEIRENEECWVVDKLYNLLPESEKINEFKRNYYSNCFIFSTREAAEEYILNNRPLLSLNDVKEWVEAAKRSNLSMDFILEKAERTARQKLNQ